MKATAIITAGGIGTRILSPVPKQFIPIAGLPLIIHTLRAFDQAQTIDHVIVVLPETESDRLNQHELKRYEIQKVTAVVFGGETRQVSVGNGLEAIRWGAKYVAIHDAARCLVTPELVDRTVAACNGWDGAIAALPVRDTIKLVEGETILKTEPREKLWAMQTPQVFRFPFILDAYRNAKATGLVATDDAAVAEKAGGKIRVIEGSSRNLKITFEEDLRLAETILKAGGK
ncbi:MAG: 2-C-methyl-D-erythritol 4-phosphate cytidylyltransferase [Pseudomonadota bacterium]